MKEIGFYYLVVNVLAFVLFAVDKSLAKQHKHRIREVTLLISVLLGGGIGAFLSMQLFRHKTDKSLFCVFVLFSIILHGVLLWFWLGGKIL